MKTTITAAHGYDSSDASLVADADRLENMRELLADLRSSIRTQRHLIDVSRALLERT